MVVGIIAEFTKRKKWRPVMIRYLVFGISSLKGGVESFILNYVGHMQDAENVFEFVMFEKKPDFFEHSTLKNCKVHILPFRTKHPLLYYRRCNEIFRKNQYDVIWYNVCTLSDVTLLQFAKKAGVPTRIVHSHNSENMGGFFVEILHNYHKKKIQELATDYFACSMKAAEFMFPEKIRKSPDFRLIKNAIDAEKYKFNEEIRKKVRKEMGLNGKFVIGHVGRFHFQKNHKMIIEIFEKLQEKNKDSLLMLVGSGELKEEIIKIAETKKILEKILFLENREDINELLQAMDVFLFPSFFEGAPIALIEAQAADLPCIVSDTIAKESLISEKIIKLSLGKTQEFWANVVLEQAKERKRKDNTKLLKENGYDIRSSATWLKEYIRENRV